MEDCCVEVWKAWKGVAEACVESGVEGCVQNYLQSSLNVTNSMFLRRNEGSLADFPSLSHLRASRS